MVAFIQNTDGRALRVLELPGFQRPAEGRKPRKGQPGNAEKHENEDVHHTPPLLSGPAIRRAFSVTTADEADMAIAAISGVTHPASAIGMTTTL